MKHDPQGRKDPDTDVRGVEGLTHRTQACRQLVQAKSIWESSPILTYDLTLGAHSLLVKASALGPPHPGARLVKGY